MVAIVTTIDQIYYPNDVSTNSENLVKIGPADSEIFGQLCQILLIILSQNLSHQNLCNY